MTKGDSAEKVRERISLICFSLDSDKSARCNFARMVSTSWNNSFASLYLKICFSFRSMSYDRNIWFSAVKSRTRFSKNLFWSCTPFISRLIVISYSTISLNAASRFSNLVWHSCFSLMCTISYLSRYALAWSRSLICLCSSDMSLVYCWLSLICSCKSFMSWVRSSISSIPDLNSCPWLPFE